MPSLHLAEAQLAAGGCVHVYELTWPAYDTDQRLVQLFDAESTVTAYPEELSRRIWQNHDFPVLQLIGR